MPSIQANLDTNSALFRVVPCPHCGAAREARCVRAGGTEIVGEVHRGRELDAVDATLTAAARRLSRGNLSGCRAALSRVGLLPRLSPVAINRMSDGWAALGRAERAAGLPYNE